LRIVDRLGGFVLKVRPLGAELSSNPLSPNDNGCGLSPGEKGDIFKASACVGLLPMVIALIALSVLVPVALIGVALFLRYNVREYESALEVMRQIAEQREQPEQPEQPEQAEQAEQAHQAGNITKGTRINHERFDSLYVRLAYFTQRFGTHAPKWQFALWMREILLFAVGSRTLSARYGSSEVFSWAQLGAALVILVGSLAWHWKKSPYVSAPQNALESGLLASLVLLLLLAFPCNSVAAADAAGRTAFDAIMTTLVLFSLVGAAAFTVLDQRRQHQHGGSIKLDEALIDSPVIPLLEDETIRLLSCRWLLVDANIASLATSGDPPGPPKLKRLQKMPEEAFLSGKEAARLFKSGQRQVLVLSYGWLSPEEPDPWGMRLASILRFLKNESSAGRDIEACGLFMDHVCLPQEPRDPEEEKKFQLGLARMASLYASITGTTVLQLTEVPPEPPDWFPTEKYNRRKYLERGWCCFEEGLAQMVVAHLSDQRDNKQLPTEHERAEKSRDKLIAIDTGEPDPFEAENKPEALLNDLKDRVDKAYFFKARDRRAVQRQISNFTSAIAQGVEAEVSWLPSGWQLPSWLGTPRGRVRPTCA